MATLNLEQLSPLLRELERHPIYRSLHTVDDLRVFMSHHIFSVWDFMSLVKYLQRQVAPTEIPWLPQGSAKLRHYINQLALEEECDCVSGADNSLRYASHFELYCGAMEEIGADAQAPWRFLDLVRSRGIDAAFDSDLIPQPSRQFCETTFGLIREDQPHCVAAALALGRERVIPEMFRRILREMRIDSSRAPTFHYYLERHVHLDEGLHAPLSLELLEEFCGDDEERIEAALAAAEESICARLRFWDGVLDAIESRREVEVGAPDSSALGRA